MNDSVTAAFWPQTKLRLTMATKYHDLNLQSFLNQDDFHAVRGQVHINLTFYSLEKNKFISRLLSCAESTKNEGLFNTHFVIEIFKLLLESSFILELRTSTWPVSLYCFSKAPLNSMNRLFTTFKEDIIYPLLLPSREYRLLCNLSFQIKTRPLRLIFSNLD